MATLFWILLLAVSSIVSLSISTSYQLIFLGSIPDGIVLFDVFFAVIFIAPLLFSFNHLKIGGDFKQQLHKHKMLVLFFTALSLVAIAFLLIMSLNNPHGEWDARAIWNLHARFLFRGGEEWNKYLVHELAWSHPDYPLLLPALIARFWVLAGEELQIFPILISVSFTVLIVFLMVISLMIISDVKTALIGGIILFGSPALLANGASQYADVPVALFFLSSIVLLTVYERVDRKKIYLFLAFTSGAAAGWTKNEGLLFLIILIFCFTLYYVISYGFKEFIKVTPYIIAGILPVLIIVVFFKLFLAPPNDIIGSQGLKEMIARVVQLDRYLLVAKSFAGMTILFNNGVFPILVGMLLFAKIDLKYHRSTMLVISIALLMFVGNFCVYIVSPNNLYFHLGTSLDRLFLQLYPLIIFIMLSFCGIDASKDSKVIGN